MCFRVFTNEEIVIAKEYKYSGTDDSLLVNYFLKYLWNTIVEYIPMTVAPNAITFAGFFLEVMSFTISFWVSKSMTHVLPMWCCVLNGLCTLLYQCLDNLDGKQARRTKTSSPMGQFFDHGCDAITGALELAKVAMTLTMGCGMRTFYFIYFLGVGFYLTSWEEYSLGRFYLGYINGPDEGLFLLGWIQIIIGFYPNTRKAFDNKYVDYLVIFLFFATILVIFINVIKQAYSDSEKMKKSIISLFPAIISGGIFLAHYLVFDNVLSPYFILSSGLLLQYSSQLIIVATLVKRRPFAIYHISLVFLWIAALSPFVFPNFSSVFFWKVYFCTLILIMVVQDVRVLHGFSVGLDIPVFSIKKHMSTEHHETISSTSIAVTAADSSFAPLNE